MKMITKASLIFILLIMVMSCAATPDLPEKYNLNNYLEEVKGISTARVSGWENIDNQSIIIRSDLRAVRGGYYLLVLRRPIDTRYSNVAIGIENTAAKDRAYSTQNLVSNIRDSRKSNFHQAPSNIVSIRSGHDRVVVAEPAGATYLIDYYIIDRIYKLNGREQAEEIITWLRQDTGESITRIHHFIMDSE